MDVIPYQTMLHKAVKEPYSNNKYFCLHAYQPARLKPFFFSETRRVAFTLATSVRKNLFESYLPVKVSSISKKMKHL